MVGIEQTSVPYARLAHLTNPAPTRHLAHIAQVQRAVDGLIRRLEREHEREARLAAAAAAKHARLAARQAEREAERQAAVRVTWRDLTRAGLP